MLSIFGNSQNNSDPPKESLENLILPAEILSHIFSFLQAPSDYLRVALTCRDWKEILYEIKIDYFDILFYHRHECPDDPGVGFKSCFLSVPFSSLASVFPPRLLSQEEGKQYFSSTPTYFAALISDCPKAESRSLFMCAVADLDEKMCRAEINDHEGNFKTTLVLPDPIIKICAVKNSDRFILATSNGDLFSYADGELSKQLNFFHRVAESKTSSAKTQIEEDLPLENKKRKNIDKETGKKKRKLTDIELRDFYHLTDRYYLVETKNENERTFYIFDSNSNQLVEELEEGSYKASGSVLVKDNLQLVDEEGENPELKIFKFDENTGRYVLKSELVLADIISERSIFYGESGRLLSDSYFTSVSTAIEEDAEREEYVTGCDYKILDENFIFCTVNMSKNNQSKALLYSIETGELTEIFSSSNIKEDAVLKDTIIVANHHVVLTYHESKNNNLTLLIRNLLTGTNDLFASTDLLPRKNARIHDYKIVERDGSRSLIVCVKYNNPNDTSLSFEFVEIPLGNDVKIGPVPLAVEERNMDPISTKYHSAFMTKDQMLMISHRSSKQKRLFASTDLLPGRNAIIHGFWLVKEEGTTSVRVCMKYNNPNHTSLSFEFVEIPLESKDVQISPVFLSNEKPK